MTVQDVVTFPKAADIPPDMALPSIVEQREYLVGGVLRRWDGAVEDVVSPIWTETATGLEPRVIGRQPMLGEAEAMQALDAAVAAYAQGLGDWPTRPVGERIAAIESFVMRMVARRADVVKLLQWEIAKSRTDAEREFDRTVQYVRDTIDALKDLDRASSRFQIEDGIIAQIRRAPLGVVMCMGPYNYPLNETFTTLIPALIMGNTVVFKPARFGVLLWGPLLEAFRDSFPAGVVNTIYGDGRTVVGPIMASGRIDVLAFIGTSRVADVLKKAHPAPHRLRGVLGLEAKNPAIVLADADLDLAVRECILGTLSFNGQRCTALKILFVQRTIADAFLDRLAKAVDALPAGMPWDKGVAITPLPETGKPAYLDGLVADAVALGARVVNAGGGRTRGSFYSPAIVYPVAPAARLYVEEQFGPVIPVVPFDDVAEAISYVVDSKLGQQISVFGRDPATIAGLIDPFVNQVSRVNINSQCQRGPDVFPFTGRKDSAEATLSVSDALRTFSIRTMVAAKGEPLNKQILTDIVREHRSKFLSTDFLL